MVEKRGGRQERVSLSMTESAWISASERYEKGLDLRRSDAGESYTREMREELDPRRSEVERAMREELDLSRRRGGPIVSYARRC
jgi:hypothetical protein